jgi:hypothetical protein
MKISIFWDITLCSPFKLNRRFGGTRRFHLQVKEETEQETSVKALLATSFHNGLSLGLFFDTILRNVG